MNPIDLFDDLLGPINPIARVLGTMDAIRAINRRKARASGFVGIVGAVSGTIAGIHTHQFGIPRDGAHSIDDIRALLYRYGIPTFTLLHDHENLYFSVKQSQARWAEYLLLQAGVQVINRQYDECNAHYPVQHAPGWMPTPWSEGGKANSTDQINGRADQQSGDVIETSRGNTSSSVGGWMDWIMGNPQGPPEKQNKWGMAESPGQARAPQSWTDQIMTAIDRLLGEE